MLLLHSERKLFGKTLITLLVSALFVLMPTPATSVATGNSETSGSTSISNSVSFKKPQGLSADISISHSKGAATAASSSAAALSAPALRLAPEASILLPSSSIFTWGHVTKYSSILYDEDIVIKGPIVLDVKYPQIANSNSYTIIGIQAYNNDDDLNADYTTGNLALQVYPAQGGIGYNSTVIRFSLDTDYELHYKLVIHGVDI